MPNARNWVYGLLRRSESFFKTDMVYLAKGGFWLTGSQVALSLLSFVSSIAFANLLLPEIYGTYKYLISLAAILSALSFSGLSTALIRSVAKGYEGDFIKAFWLNIRWSIIINFVGGLGAIYYFLNGNNLLALGILAAGTISPLIDSAELYNSFLVGRKNFRLLAILKFIRSLVTSSVLITSLFLTDNPLLLAIIFFGINAVTTLYLFYYVYRKLRPNKEVDSKMVGLAKHTSIMNSLAVFSDSFDNILVFHYLGPIQLAVYNFALAIPNQLGGFVKTINTLALPKFANQDKDVFQQTMFKKSIPVFLSGLVVALAYILISPFIFKSFFPQYLSSLPYTQVYAAILVFSAALPVAFLDAQVAIKEKYLGTILSNSFKIISLFFGIYYFGLWGLVIARIASKTFSVSTAYILARNLK